MGVVVSDTTMRTRMAVAERDGELAEETTHDAAHQQNRDEDRDQRHADGEDGEADLRAPLSAASYGFMPASR